MTNEGCRERYWKMELELYNFIKKATPNPAHNIFKYFHDIGKLRAIITQNIDGLHEISGIPEEKVISIHGTCRKILCQTCKKVYSAEEIFIRVEGGTKSPLCVCGGILKPATISFGQALDKDVLENAKKGLEECDLLIIVGSSLVVQPANQLPIIALNKKVPLIIINKGNTKYDKYSHVVVDCSASQTFTALHEDLSPSN